MKPGKLVADFNTTRVLVARILPNDEFGLIGAKPGMPQSIQKSCGKSRPSRATRNGSGVSIHKCRTAPQCSRSSAIWLSKRSSEASDSRLGGAFTAATP